LQLGGYPARGEIGSRAHALRKIHEQGDDGMPIDFTNTLDISTHS
jgi:hypothetical protein